MMILFFTICFGLVLVIPTENVKAQKLPGENAGFPKFHAHLVDEFPGGYKVNATDLNNDGRFDIIGLSTDPTNLVWYENPYWEKHVLTTKTSGNIDLATYDIDEDGRIDLALASEFNMRETLTGGLIQWLRCPNLPTDEWTPYYVHSEPTSHRLLWADIDGDGSKELINAPVMGRGAKEPEWDVGVNLTWFRIPDPPDTKPWEPRLIDNQLTVLHGIAVVDWDGDRRDEILTASFEGVHLFQSKGYGDDITWIKTKLGEGHQSNPPERGSSEVALGHLQDPGKRFIATIEPWHGNNVVVYVPDSKKSELWKRLVIDRNFNEGHALVTADLDNDGCDEIIAGYRGSGSSLYIFRCLDSTGKSWERIPLDEGDMATSGLDTADLNRDGKLDIIAIGTSTGNIKWYENLGHSGTNQ